MSTTVHVDERTRLLPGLAAALNICRDLAETPGPGGLPRDADDCADALAAKITDLLIEGAST